MPYLYSAVRESHETGMPIMRALWLHYPDDPSRGRARRPVSVGPRHPGRAGRREGRDVARSCICRSGTWFDFWTERAHRRRPRDRRAVDLATMPLYVRAGAIMPMGPVKQYTGRTGGWAATMTVYPGADGSFDLLRGRRALVRIPARRLDGHQLQVDRCVATIVARAHPRIADAAADVPSDRSTARRIAEGGADDLHRPSADRAALTAILRTSTASEPRARSGS